MLSFDSWCVFYSPVTSAKATPWIHGSKKVVLSSGKTQLKMGKQSGDHTCVGKSLKVHKTCCLNNRAPYLDHKWFIEVLSNLILLCHAHQASLGGASESTCDLAIKAFNSCSQTCQTNLVLAPPFVYFKWISVIDKRKISLAQFVVVF